MEPTSRRLYPALLLLRYNEAYLEDGITRPELVAVSKWPQLSVNNILAAMLRRGLTESVNRRKVNPLGRWSALHRLTSKGRDAADFLCDRNEMYAFNDDDVLILGTWRVGPEGS